MFTKAVNTSQKSATESVPAWHAARYLINTYRELGDYFRFGRHPAGRQRASKSGLSMFGLLDYRGWPRRRLHSPRAERMKVRPPSPPSAQSVQTKKKPPGDLAISP